LGQQNVPTVVVLEPGPPIDVLVNAARKRAAPSVVAWLQQHSHSGGVEGAEKNEAVIAAGIVAASQLGNRLSIGGHSLLGMLARKPELAQYLKGAHIALVNPAFSAPDQESLAHTFLAELPPAKTLLQLPSVRQLTRTDDFSPEGYKLSAGAQWARHYGEYVEQVAPQIGDILSRLGVAVRIWASSDRLVSVETAKKIAGSLHGEFNEMQGQLASPGNRGVMPHGNQSEGNTLTADYSKLPHSPRDAHALPYEIMNDYLLTNAAGASRRADEISSGNTDTPEGGMSMDAQVDENSIREDSTGQRQKLHDSILRNRPTTRSLSWPAEDQ
jgi:hypothetical protein